MGAKRIEFYFKAGMIERGPRYAWCVGWSRVTPTSIEYPWVTSAEAVREAAKHGARAEFFSTQELARAAMVEFSAQMKSASSHCLRCGMPWAAMAGPGCERCDAEDQLAADHAADMEEKS